MIYRKEREKRSQLWRRLDKQANIFRVFKKFKVSRRTAGQARLKAGQASLKGCTDSAASNFEMFCVIRGGL